MSAFRDSTSIESDNGTLENSDEWELNEDIDGLDSRDDE